MQLMRFHRGQAIAVFACALLSGLAAGQATATVPALLLAAAEAARRDVDPSVNGAVGDVLHVPSSSQFSDTAATEQRDGDPSFNGRLVDSRPPQAVVVGGSDLTSAWDAYERCHWQAAFSAFAAAADAGVPEAARMALVMARHGTQLYRQVFVVSAAQQGSWQRLSRLASASAANVPSAQGVTR